MPSRAFLFCWRQSFLRLIAGFPSHPLRLDPGPITSETTYMNPQIKMEIEGGGIDTRRLDASEIPLQS